MKIILAFLVLVGTVCANDVPTFPFFSWSSGKAGEVNFVVANNSGKLAVVGVSSQAAATFPEAVVACVVDEREANKIACNTYSCTSLTACKEESIATVKIDFYPLATVTMTGSFPNFNSVLWFEVPIPTAVTAATVTNQKWLTYSFTPGALALQKSDFEYIVSVGKSDPSETIVKLDGGQTSFSAVGFRANAAADYPAYVILCTTALSKCEDAKCTDKSKCTMNNPIGVTTEYDKNTGRYTVVSKQKDVPVKADTILYLASLRSTEAAALKEDLIQGKTWKYQVGLPRSNAKLALPSLLAFVGLLFILSN